MKPEERVLREGFPLPVKDVPLVLIHSPDGAVTATATNSLSNAQHNEHAERLVKAIQRLDDTLSIGVLYYYDNTVSDLRRRLRGPNIKVATVDSYEGQQVDCAIVVMARTSEQGRSPFLNDDRKTTMLVSRARLLFAVIGDLDALYGRV